MEIVSIKRFLRPGPPKPESYIRFLQLLLNGISTHAAEGNEIELARFRQEVATIAGQLTVESTTEEIETALGFVMRAVTGYNRMAVRITQAHVNELQAMLAMMSRTIAYLSDSSKTGITQLQAVEKKLQTASTIGDVRVLRGKLNDCLVLVRNESNRLRDESHAHIAELQSSLERTANHVRSSGIAPPEDHPPPPKAPRPATPLEDPLTGLPGRDSAEALIAKGIAESKQFAVALCLIDRYTHIEARYGVETGEEALLLVAQHLGAQLQRGTLFRWSGPAFAVIAETDQPLHVVEQQMIRLVSKRFEKTIQKDGRTVLVPVTCCCMAQKVSDVDSLEAVAESLDDFVATKLI